MPIPATFPPNNSLRFTKASAYHPTVNFQTQMEARPQIPFGNHPYARMLLIINYYPRSSVRIRCVKCVAGKYTIEILQPDAKLFNGVVRSSNVIVTLSETIVNYI
jgi:hypothetical protein